MTSSVAAAYWDEFLIRSVPWWFRYALLNYPEWLTSYFHFRDEGYDVARVDPTHSEAVADYVAQIRRYGSLEPAWDETPVVTKQASLEWAGDDARSVLARHSCADDLSVDIRTWFERAEGLPRAIFYPDGSTRYLPTERERTKKRRRNSRESKRRQRRVRGDVPKVQGEDGWYLFYGHAFVSGYRKSGTNDRQRPILECCVWTREESGDGHVVDQRRYVYEGSARKWCSQRLEAYDGLN